MRGCACATRLQRGCLIEPKNKEYIAEVVLADGTIFGKTGQLTFASPSFNAQTGTFLIRANR